MKPSQSAIGPIRPNATTIAAFFAASSAAWLVAASCPKRRDQDRACDPAR
jgi:hypothetical protein